MPQQRPAPPPAGAPAPSPAPGPAPAPAPAAALIGRLTLQTPLGAVLSDSRIRLLEAIDRCGSLNRAAREVPLSYKAAWDALDTMNRLAPQPLVVRSTGGAGGGGTRLTDFARQLVQLHRAMESNQQDILDRLGPVPADTDAATLRTLIRRLGLRTSARNQFAARVAGLDDQGGTVAVRLVLGDPEAAAEPAAAAPTIEATITPEAASELGLALGREVWALVKAPVVQVLPASARPPRRAPGRNLLAGQVQALRPGAQRCAVTLALADGSRLHAAVEPRQAEALQVGDAAWGLFDGDQVVLLSFG